jgi:hypothetical protein
MMWSRCERRKVTRSQRGAWPKSLVGRLPTMYRSSTRRGCGPHLNCRMPDGLRRRRDCIGSIRVGPHAEIVSRQLPSSIK